MCGRKTLTKSKLDIIKELSLDEWDELDDWTPSYNVAPTQKHPVIFKDDDSTTVKLSQWGLVPSWAKEMSIGAKMINARIETVAEKPSFRNLVNRQRCLIPADGYYEWRAETHGKQPYYIHLPDEKLFTFAGLRSIWNNSNDVSMLTYTVITTQAADHLQQIHPRMPVTIPEQLRSEWLDTEITYTEISDSVQFGIPEWQIRPVSPVVNRVSVNHPGCLEPYTPPVQGSLFG